MTKIDQETDNTLLQLRISGMHCAGCAATVQRAAEDQPGVQSAQVNVTDGSARVRGAGFDVASIVRAIESKGFPAETVDQTEAPRERLSEIERRQHARERAWRIRAIVGLSLWAPLETLHWTAAAAGWHTPWMPWVMLLGSAIVISVAGWGFYKSAFNAARKRTTNMDTLIALGATTAFVYSLIVFILQLNEAMYFAEAAGLLGIVSLGHWFEAKSSAKAGSAVRDLLELQPETAERIVRDEETETIPSSDVAQGDRLLVRPGGRVPVDGQVIDGSSDVDESIVTGESVPVNKQPGDQLIAGSINTTGRLVVESTVSGRDTTVARIADMVQEAQSSKAEIQRLADKVASIFVPAVLTIAVTTFTIWAFVVGDASTGAIAATTVLIISCPCALGLATPMAVMVGAGAASKRGILVKSAAAFEQSAAARRVIFDKTGTLTCGQPVVTHVNMVNSQADETTLLTLAASVEAASEHPMARAIVSAAKERSLSLRPITAFETIPGRGVRAQVDGKVVKVTRDDRESCQVLVDNERLGTIAITDEIRSDAREAVETLRTMGFEIRMLTGDREHVAREIGAQLGLRDEEIVAEATPASKRSFAEREGGNAIMVGDGINDAAALAASRIGVALASGTQIAVESADVVIPGERVGAIPDFIHLAQRTMRTIRQNLFFAFFYNSLAIPVAALGLLGPYGPLWAALAMGFSDITVIGNALRLKWGLDRKHTGA